MRSCLLLAVLVCGISANAQFPYHPLPYKQSDFKKIKEKGYTVLSVYKRNEESKELSTKVEYGNSGLIAAIYEMGTNDDGDSLIMSETYFKFDAKGKLVGKDVKDPDMGEARTVFTYDAAGRLIKKQTATIDPPTYKYKYDAKGRLMEVNVTQTMPVYDDNGDWQGKTVENPSSRYVYKYDAKGRLAEEWDYDLPIENKTDPPSYKMLWSYNDKNQVIMVKRVNSDGTEMNRVSYEYNSDGLIIRSIENQGEDDEIFIYEYCIGCKQSWMK